MLTLFRILKRKANSFINYRTPLGEFITFCFSLILHMKFSFNERRPGLDKERLEYYLVKHCHIVEKGMALPKTRFGFGQPKITDLIKKTREYESRYADEFIGCLIRDTLHEYMQFHEKCIDIFPQDFLNNLQSFLEEKVRSDRGGLKSVIKSEMANVGSEVFERFLKCRHSVRNYSDTSVDIELIKRAITISQNTPSVCNRQGWFVYCYEDKDKIQELLSYQNGNAGFSQCIDKLLIVTGSTKAFTRFEHNQLFIDGGLYSMNLMLSLHSVGLASCPLNTCLPWGVEKNLKEAAFIDEHERLIMMISVGNLLDEFNVAQSEKYSIDKMFRVFNS